jgi:hypothetical protein
MGLSVARNVGLRAATGPLVAYTDSDCFADPDWLTHLVDQLSRSGASAVGGPNLTPEDGWLPACVAAAPGQPTHVLESDQVAEHVPGCNMLFRREALEAINGFDPQYRKAGDDVDVCWRLQQAGFWITFAPAAFVWHHRRQGPRAFLRQQAGYGEAEALLRFKHPEKFNGRGGAKWRGVMYGAALRGLRLGRPIVYRGTFAAGLFQTLYQPGPAHWAMLPGTLEWHAAAALVALAGFFWPAAWLVTAAMLLLAVVVAGLQATQATVPAPYGGILSRLVIAWLCYAQPLVRSWRRYRTRLLSWSAPRWPIPSRGAGGGMPLSGDRRRAFWSEQGCQRTDVLAAVVARLKDERWGTAYSDWSEWDVEVHGHPWTLLRICTAQEDHGGRRHLIRVRYALRPTGFGVAVAGLSFVAAAVVACVNVWLGAAAAVALAAATFAAWRRGARLASQVVRGVDDLASGLGLLPCPAAGDPPAAGTAETITAADEGTVRVRAEGSVGEGSR